MDKATDTESNFLVAAKQGNLQTIKDLHQGGVNINVGEVNTGLTALHLSVASHENDVFDYLLEQDDIDVNVTNSKGRTPIIQALLSENIYAVGKLLEKEDIDLTLKETDSLKTVFAWADVKGHKEISKILSDKSGVPLQEDGCFISKKRGYSSYNPYQTGGGIFFW